MFQIDDIKEKNIDKFYEIYLTGGKLKLIEAIAEGLGKRSYFTIDSNGTIKRKNMNHALPLITTLNNEDPPFPPPTPPIVPRAPWLPNRLGRSP